MNTSVSGHSTMSSALPNAMNYHRWIGDFVCRWLEPGPLLEIGPGYGQYTLRLAAHAERVLALDIDITCVEHVQRFGGNVDALVADISAEQADERIVPESWASIVCLNVLEHARNDVRSLEHMRRWLRPQGRAVLVLPAHPALYGPMDKLAGHYRRYTRRDIHDKLASVGLRELYTGYINPLGGLGWWLNAKLAQPENLSAPHINRQIALFDRLVLPFSRMLTPLTHRLFGQSLLVVAERPSLD